MPYIQGPNLSGHILYLIFSISYIQIRPDLVNQDDDCGFIDLLCNQKIEIICNQKQFIEKFF